MAVVKLTREMAEQALRETDWARLDAQSDEEIARNVADDPDAPKLLTKAETISAFAKTIREGLGLSQEQFSARFQIPLGTLRDWEQGRAKPDGAAMAYLRVISARAEMVAAVLGG
jgi:putative transcriptional regulator